MDSGKYIGMDVHQATISVGLLDSAGKLVMEPVIETKAVTILRIAAFAEGSSCAAALTARGFTFSVAPAPPEAAALPNSSW